MISTTTTAVMFEDVLRALVTVGAYARLVATASEAERFFFRGPRRFMSMSGSPAETFADFTAAFGNRECYFSPIAWSAPRIGSAPLPLHALWARLPVALLAQQRHHPAPGVDPASAATMRAKLASFSLPPTITIDEGDAITGIWKLDRPLADLAYARRLLLRLAAHFDGDRRMADLASALVRIPGTRNTSVYPGHDVMIAAWEPERAYTVEQFEDRLSASRKGA